MVVRVARIAPSPATLLCETKEFSDGILEDDLLRRDATFWPYAYREVRAPKGLSLEIIVAILEFVVDEGPKIEETRLWPMVRSRQGHLRRDGETFAIRADFDVVLRSPADTFGLRGYWAAATETTVRSFLCIDEMDIDVEAMPSLQGDRVFWLRRGTADDGARRVMCCSVTRDVVSRGLENSNVIRAVDVDVLGIDFSLGRRFSYTPKGATISKAIQAHFQTTILVKHRIAEFIHGDGHAFWVTKKTRADTLSAQLQKFLSLRGLPSSLLGVAPLSSPEEDHSNGTTETTSLATKVDHPDDKITSGPESPAAF